MPVVDFKVNISGLQELAQSLSPAELDVKITTGLVNTASELHKALVNGVHDRYALNQSLNDVFIGKAPSVSGDGTEIRATLAYEYKSIDLSQFPYSPTEIPNRYAVHRVTVLRNATKVVNGVSGNGGFVPRKGSNHPTSPNQAWLARDGKTKMFERKGRSRLPLRVLYGPSLSQMAGNVLLTNPTSEISNIVDNLDILVTSKVDI